MEKKKKKALFHRGEFIKERRVGITEDKLAGCRLSRVWDDFEGKSN